ncbi:MAG: sulfite exporter TauE/SafE family protein [Acidimicrobiia bacterium]|nr:sulfite exporter TauE/SafE family protein [Acidimicrobiia bacterium]
MSPRPSANESVRAAILGVFAGVVSGLFGVGGGVVVVPGLVLWVGLDQRRASATSLATIVASAGAALLLFGAASSVDWIAAGYLLIGAVFGAWVGARFLDRVPANLLTWTFAALMLAAAARLGFGS